MKFVDGQGKTPELAIEAALKELGVKRDEVETETLDAGSKGILGIGAKPAVVRVSIIFDPERTATDFLKDIGASMGVSMTVETNLTDKNLNIIISGDNMGILIGKRGQTLDALQHLVSLAVNKGYGQYLSINLDSENYRDRRKESLEKLALNIARKVKATKKPVTLEPMSTLERRIIHAVLQGDRGIATHSEGSDPYRNIVIAPKRSYNTPKKTAPVE
ncbi:MAG: protein jag [Defluviitaleaceae bacterium]|nr:protein jag [Defluviitaleaceae bacterium]